MFKALAEYQKTIKLYETSDEVVYRSHKKENHEPVILKVLKKEYPDAKVIARLRREFEIMRRFQGKGFLEVLSLDKVQLSYVLVMRDFSGELLSEVLNKDALTMTQFFSIAAQLTDILGHVHNAGIVHKNINPQGILWDRQDHKIRLIDCNIASQLTSTNTSIVSANVFEGSLYYMSPEQTGRMNRPLDYRSDFYSLGALFYKMLTGHTPFETKDAMELVHCHIAKQPPELNTFHKDFPPPLNEILFKLMAKNAEDRYQSCHGLKADLMFCQEQLTAPNKILKYKIGQNDIPQRFSISQKMYAREVETEILLSTFERVAEGSRELILVSGHAGVGKSLVVNEIHKSIVAKHGLFTAGKFSQFERDIPYRPLIHAFQKLIRQLLAEDENEINLWKKKILENLESNGQIIAEVIPEIELIIGIQPTLTELPVEQAQERFHLVFQNFFHTFASSEHPLVIFLDDLQWADLPTLKLLESLITDPKNKYLLIIGAYRDNEVNQQHSLNNLLDNISTTNIAVNNIKIKSLALVDIKNLLVDTLYSDLQTVTPLAKLCMEKTQGNPFFLNQFLLGLQQNSQIYLDQKRGKWVWDIEKIKQTAITDNVIEFMTHKIRGLSEGLQAILPYAACIGSQFDLKTISAVCKQSMESTANELWQALQSGLIVSTDHSYQLIDFEHQYLEQNFHYRFLHDRVQQAAYELLAETAAQEVHLHLARIMLEKSTPVQLQENLFDIVNHLNYAEQLITTENEHRQLASLNLAAGEKAKRSAAFEAAYNYHRHGIQQLGTKSWQQDYTLSLNLHTQAAEAAYLSGHFLQMNNWVDVILLNAENTLDQIMAYEIRINALVAQGQLKEALDSALETLKILQLNLPRSPNILHFLFGLLDISWFMSRHKLNKIEELPELTDPLMLAKMRILANIIVPSYFSEQLLTSLINFSMMKITMRFGKNIYSPFALAFYSMIVSGVFGDPKRAGDICRLGVLLQSQRRDKLGTVRVEFVYYAMIRPLEFPIRESLPPLQDIFHKALEVGDLGNAAYAAHGYCMLAFFAGKPLPELYREMQQYLQTLQAIKQEIPRSWLSCWLQNVANLMGENSVPHKFVGKYFNIETDLAEKIQMQDKSSIFIAYYNQVSLSYTFQEFSKAQQSGVIAKTYFDKVNAGPSVVNFFLFDSLANLALYRTATFWQKIKIRKVVASNQKLLKKWAQGAPMNYQHKWILVNAELARVLGKSSKAKDYYEQAISGAQKNDFLQEEALANELYARYWQDLKQLEFSNLYLNKAFYLYQQWGAQAKVKQLQNEFPMLNLGQEQTEENWATPAFANINKSQPLDFSAIIKASQAISSKIQLRHLLKSLITICIEQANAQNACILLKRKKTWFVEAEGALGKTTKSLPPRPLKEELHIAKSIVQQTIKTQDPIVVVAASRDERFAKDPYIIQQQPKSIICIPILYHGKCDGILYMENNLSAHTFTPDTLETLQLLTSQAAISIENARWYDRHIAEKETEILQQKEIQLLKQSAIDALEQSNRLKDDFLHVIGHELRTPLHGINGSLSLALNGGISQTGKLLLEVAQTASFDLLSIIDKILFFSELQAGQVEQNPKQFSLTASLDEIIHKFENITRDKNLQIELNIDQSLSQTIILDQDKLNYIVEELVHNAVNFTERGTITINVSQHNSCLLAITISDTGPGIAKKTLPNIFAPFSKVDASFRRNIGGLGIGLSVCQKLARAMSGEIEVSSKIAQGSRFSLKVPYTPGDSLAGNVLALPTTKVTAQKNLFVLIVEDNLVNQLILERMIARLGHRTHTAGNGKIAVEYLAKNEVDFIFMDCQMPVMDGLEATRQIRQLANKNKLCPIVAVTANVLEQDRKDCLAAGMDDFLKKPINTKSIIADIINKHATERVTKKKTAA